MTARPRKTRSASVRTEAAPATRAYQPGAAKRWTQRGLERMFKLWWEQRATRRPTDPVLTERSSGIAWLRLQLELQYRDVHPAEPAHGAA